MRGFIHKLFNALRPNDKARPARRGLRRLPLQVEALEGRQLLSVAPIPLPLPQVNTLDPIQSKYWSLGGPDGILGQSVSGEMATPYGGGLYEKFQHGAIFYSQGTGAHDVLLPTENEFFKTGKETDAFGNIVEKMLGLPTQDETSSPVLSGVDFTDFQAGTIFSSPSAGAHVVYGGIGAEYATLAYRTDYYGNNVQAILGAPTSDEMNVPGVSGARMNTFQGGDIYWSSSTGAHVVYGGIGAKYSSLGGPKAYGLPTSDEAWLSDGQLIPENVRVTYFQGGGAIYWTPATGAHEVHGSIQAEFSATDSETDAYSNNVQIILGAPTSDEMNVPGVSGARMNTFQGGAIYWSSSTGAHVVYGGIAAKYNSLGGPASYGLPTSDEVRAPGLSGVRVTYFQNGALFWSAATGAHAVYGLIGTEYAATANMRDFYGSNVQAILGAPTSDEMNVPGVSGARMNTFQGGDIYWSPNTGAHVVYGFGGLYQSMGGPTSYLGLPTTDPQPMTGGMVQYFQYGKIWWTPAGGAHAVKTVSQMTFNWTINLGAVTGSAQLTLYSNGAYNFVGKLNNSAPWWFDDSVMFGLMSPSGVLFTFTHKGSMGPLGSDNWDNAGRSPALAAGWADLQGAQGNIEDSTNWDIGGLLKEMQQVLGVANTILAIVGS